MTNAIYKGKLYADGQSEVYHSGKARTAGAWSNLSHFTFSQEEEREMMFGFISFSPFHIVRYPNQNNIATHSGQTFLPQLT